MLFHLWFSQHFVSGHTFLCSKVSWPCQDEAKVLLNNCISVPTWQNFEHTVTAPSLSRKCCWCCTVYVGTFLISLKVESTLILFAVSHIHTSHRCSRSVWILEEENLLRYVHHVPSKVNKLKCKYSYVYYCRELNSVFSFMHLVHWVRPRNLKRLVSTKLWKTLRKKKPGHL